MRTAIRNCSLSIFFGAIFLMALVGQAFVGRGEYNEQRLADGLPPIDLWTFVTSAHFAVDVTENWQSEYLQFLLFIWVTVYLVQRGSPESSALDQVGRESDQKQKLGAYVEQDSPVWARVGGWRTALYSRSLSLVMAAIFLLSWFAQSVAGWVVYNEEQLRNQQPLIDWTGYLVSPEFWNRTLQNWQSEFLAVGSMVALAIFLRERGSPESKPVGEPHATTGASG